MRLVPVFILETHNASDNKCLPKFVQTDNASSSIKTATERSSNMNTHNFWCNDYAVTQSVLIKVVPVPVI